MNDNGGIVLGWLTKLVVVLSVLGVLSYDGISVLSATFAAADRADTLAREAAQDYAQSRDVNTTYARISAEATSTGDEIAPQDFTVQPSGRVTLVVERTATSVWMYRFSPLKKYLIVHGSGTGSPSS